jgi:hypothetical protein
MQVQNNLKVKKRKIIILSSFNSLIATAKSIFFIFLQPLVPTAQSLLKTSEMDSN